MKKRIWVTCLCMAVLSPMTLSAQEDKSDEKDFTRGWYIGAQAGMPMAEADFSSFGADKFRPGWSAGIHAGYRFTPVWSLEMTPTGDSSSLPSRIAASSVAISLTVTTTATARTIMMCQRR